MKITKLNELARVFKEEMNLEIADKPRMINISVEGKANQSAFCFALCLEERGNEPYLLATIIAGADSSLQAIKGVIDTGWYKLNYGRGEKGIVNYDFEAIFEFRTEKGCYQSFPMTLDGKKAYAIVHEEVLEGKYVISFDGAPEEDIRKVLGGRGYGLPLLQEWEKPVYEKLISEKLILDMPVYYDENVFENGFNIHRLDLDEEAADNVIKELIVNKSIKISDEIEDTGEEINEIENLTQYMSKFSDSLVDKLAEEIKPLHDPLVDKTLDIFNSYPTKLFPVQAHVATGMAKGFLEKKAMVLEGEMSTGKSKMMTAILDGYLREFKNKEGYFACLMVPSSLTDKWATKEIYDLLPNADVYLIKKSNEIIEFHQKWIANGKPKPTRPTFFVFSFTTISNGAAIEKATDFNIKSYEKTIDVNKKILKEFKSGYICPSCMQVHQVIENERLELDENGNEVHLFDKRNMLEDEFGNSRRTSNSNKPANAFCSECGDSLWKHSVPTRYNNISEWIKNIEVPLISALKEEDRFKISNILHNQPEIKKVVGKPRKVAAIEYMRRKMKNFFDFAICDEVHELKGLSARGTALGSLTTCSKKIIAGTGTLFGGMAQDVYYILWRLFPSQMVANGYDYRDVTRWNVEFGNIEKTHYNGGDSDDIEYSNKQSRGGSKGKTVSKVKPGISPFVFGKYLVQNNCLVRLLDVWPDPVELVDVPTILVPMNEEQAESYNDMRKTFEAEIESNRFDKETKISNLWLLYTETGISYLDNMMKYPEVFGKQQDGFRRSIWKPDLIEQDKILPKEAKLISLISNEIADGRASIIYVRDTGTSNKDRDIQPRLKKLLEQELPDANVAILRSNTTATDKRTQWVENKIEKEGVNVIICSMELVKVGLDLLMAPTLIFYQFSWSMFTMSQASRRSWRIGQTEECRLLYLAYENSFQEQMARLIALKKSASSAISGSASSEGLEAMLGASGDLQSMLVESIKNGDTLKGSSEEWIATTTERARELLNEVTNGGKKEPKTILLNQLLSWGRNRNLDLITLDTFKDKINLIYKNIEEDKIAGFKFINNKLQIDVVMAFGFDFFNDGDLVSHLLSTKSKEITLDNFEIKVKIIESPNTKGKKKEISGQLAIDLFGDL